MVAPSNGNTLVNHLSDDDYIEMDAYDKETVSFFLDIFNLDEAISINAEDNKDFFLNYKFNWLSAIQRHNNETSSKIAAIFLDWFRIDPEISWNQLLDVWKSLIERQASIGKRIDPLLVHQLGVLSLQMGIIPDAEANLLKSSELSKLSESDQVLVHKNNYHLGIIERDRGNYEKAKKYFEEAILGAKKFNDPLTVQYAKGQIANLLALRGKIDNAINLLNESVRESLMLKSETERNMRHTTLHTLGRLYIHQREYQKAKEVLLESVRLKELTRERFDTQIQTKGYLAEACLHLKDYKEAESYIQEKDVEKLIFIGRYGYAINILRILGLINFWQKRYHDAHRMFATGMKYIALPHNPLESLEIPFWYIQTSLILMKPKGIILGIAGLVRDMTALRLPLHRIFRLIYTRIPKKISRNKKRINNE